MDYGSDFEARVCEAPLQVRPTKQHSLRSTACEAQPAAHGL